MKLYFIIMIALSINHLFCQDGWIKQNTQSNNSIKRIYFLNENIGFAIGALGTILRTNDGGINWISIDITKDDLQDIFFINENVAWICGKNGLILYTNNGGENWVKQNTNISNWLYGIHFINDKVGWVVGDGGVILSTTDGGINWSSMKIQDSYFYDIHFVNYSTGFIVGTSGFIAFTSDGGKQWHKIDLNTSEHLYRCASIDNKIVIVGSNYTIISSYDGGVSWLIDKLKFDIDHIMDINFPSRDSIWMVTWLGKIINTTNSGNDWHIQFSSGGLKLLSVFFINSKKGWVGGESGTIYYTNNGGFSSVGEQIITGEFDLLSYYDLAVNNSKKELLFRFKIEKYLSITLKIFDLKGNIIDTIANDVYTSNYMHEIRYHYSQLPAGVYILNFKYMTGNKSFKVLLY